MGEWALGLLAALESKKTISPASPAPGSGGGSLLIIWRLWRVPALARGLDLASREAPILASPQRLIARRKANADPLHSRPWTRLAAFPLPDLDYLLNHKYAANSGVALESKAIVSFLSTLRVNLTDVLQAVRRQPGEEYSAYVTAQLSQLAAKESSLDLTTALAIINGNWRGTVAEREDHLRRYFTGILMDFDEATTALGELPNNLPPDTQQKKLDERFASLWRVLASPSGLTASALHTLTSGVPALRACLRSARRG